MQQSFEEDYFAVGSKLAICGSKRRSLPMVECSVNEGEMTVRDPSGRSASGKEARGGDYASTRTGRLRVAR